MGPPPRQDTGRRRAERQANRLRRSVVSLPGGRGGGESDHDPNALPARRQNERRRPGGAAGGRGESRARPCDAGRSLLARRASGSGPSLPGTLRCRRGCGEVEPGRSPAQPVSCPRRPCRRQAGLAQRRQGLPESVGAKSSRRPGAVPAWSGVIPGWPANVGAQPDGVGSEDCVPGRKRPLPAPGWPGTGGASSPGSRAGV